MTKFIFSFILFLIANISFAASTETFSQYVSSKPQSNKAQLSKLSLFGIQNGNIVQHSYSSNIVNTTESQDIIGIKTFKKLPVGVFARFTSASMAVDANGTNTINVIGASLSKQNGVPTMTIDYTGQNLAPNDIITKSPWIDVRAFTSLAAAVASSSTSGKTILIASSLTVDDLTIPSDRSVVVIKGGLITINNGKTLTINGPFNAGLYSVFSGNGAISFSNRDVFPQWFGAIATSGIGIDCQPFFQKAVDSIPNGGRLLIPNGAYTIIASNPTIASPKRILITHDNVTVEGMGQAIFYMTGITESYLRSILDYNSSGRDVFSLFTWRVANNGTIKNIKIIGEYNGNSAFNFKSPRAKAISVIGSNDFKASNITGVGIFGNVINVTSAITAYDGIDATSTNYLIENSYASYCWENGFDGMGGTYNGKFVNNTSEYNSSTGFETATIGMTVTGNHLMHNKYGGVSISSTTGVISSNVITNNGPVSKFAYTTTPVTYTTLVGAGITISYYDAAGDPETRMLSISGNVIKDNDGYGVYIYPKVTNLNIIGNTFENNCAMNGATSAGDTPFTVTYNSDIYVVGSGSDLIRNVLINSNIFRNITSNVLYSINANAASNIYVTNNSFELTAASNRQGYFQSTCASCVAHDNYGGGAFIISPSATTSAVYGNAIPIYTTVTIDPNPILAGESISFAVTVTGASSGNRVQLFNGNFTNGAIVSASVTATNTVTITIFNPTLATVNIANGIWKILVFTN